MEPSRWELKIPLRVLCILSDDTERMGLPCLRAKLKKNSTMPSGSGGELSLPINKAYVNGLRAFHDEQNFFDKILAYYSNSAIIK